MTYTEFICKIIRQQKKREPLYSRTIATFLQEEYNMTYEKAAAACAVAIKRIMTEKTIPELRMYQKGVYYLTATTPFGELGINKERLIEDKYLTNDMGYDGGFSLLHRVGLTTQMPRQRVIVTNKATDGLRADRQLNVVIKPPRVTINNRNKVYLQTLDMIDLLDNAPIDAENPYHVINMHIRANSIGFAELLAIAYQYYPRDTIYRIARIASCGGNEL